MKNGITLRWLRGSLLITVVTVCLAEALFLYLLFQSYYGSVRQSMVTRFSAMTGQLQVYTADTDEETAQERSLALRNMVEQFSGKDKYEFLLLDSYGGVIAASSGTSAAGIVSKASSRAITSAKLLLVHWRPSDFASSEVMWPAASYSGRPSAPTRQNAQTPPTGEGLAPRTPPSP